MLTALSQVLSRRAARSVSASSFFTRTVANEMKIRGNDVKPGHILCLNDGTLAVVKKSTFQRPGKSGSFNNLELHTLKGKKINLRLRTTETVERARVDTDKYVVLFLEDSLVHLMNSTTFEQIAVDLDCLPDDKQRPFVVDGISVEVKSCDSEIISFELPKQISLQIETNSQAKGATVKSGAYKTGTLSNGVSVMVPAFVESGDTVTVCPQTLEYLSREK